MGTVSSFANVEKIYRSTSWFSKSEAIGGVQDLNFEIHPGERVALIGPNGSGKSTTIKLMTRIIQPSKGKVSLFGMNPAKERKECTKDMKSFLDKEATSTSFFHQQIPRDC